jgi:hypothetical protein
MNMDARIVLPGAIRNTVVLKERLISVKLPNCRPKRQENIGKELTK